MQLPSHQWAKINLSKLLVFSILPISFFSCETNDDNTSTSTKTLVTNYYSIEDLVKMHNGTEKSWRFKEVLFNQGHGNIDHFPKSSCVSDDIYTFKASSTYRGLEPVQIDLGETNCFDNFSDTERYEAKINYVPEIVNGSGMLKINFILKYSTYKASENTTRSYSTSYGLSELTEDRMVFSSSFDFMENYPSAFIFEKTE